MLDSNWALKTSRELHKQGIKTSGFDLVKRFNAIKAEQYPFVLEVSKWAPQKAIQDAWDALKNWWSKKARAPHRKKKGKSKDSFYLGAGHFSLTATHFRVPKLGQVRLAQPLRFSGTPKFATISRSADQWFVSVTVDTQDPYPHQSETQAVVGVDLGVSRLVTLNTGQHVKNPRNLIKKERKLKRLHRALSRKQPGSKNRAKACLKLAKAYLDAKNTRLDLIHKLTTDLVVRFKVIGIEDLNARGMLRNHKLAKHISDASFYEFRRQLIYKAKLAGCTLVVISRWFPSSKLCSRCHKLHPDLKLGDRIFCCPYCGLKINRDKNAAINIQREALRVYQLSREAHGEKACGEDVRLPSLILAKEQPRRSRNRAVNQ